MAAKLKGVRFGKDVYGDHDTTIAFDIGAANVNVVNVTAHTMTVMTNGKVERVIPVTTGKASLPTRAGIKVIISKQRWTIMDSATVGIPQGQPRRVPPQGGLRDAADVERRVHPRGTLVGRLPGGRDVSHGCTGMSNANAAWMFAHSQIGDPVEYVNATRPLEQGNGYTDWNLPWSTWLQGSALA